jgi:NADPH:quinone reductase-like Zn-dependent oxidoreductase
VLRLDEVPEPRAPRSDELLVRVAASSINGTDLGLRRGDARIATWGRLPYVPGFDLAGEVEACGPEVTAFRPGDRVVALLSHAGGGQAERVLLRQGRAALAPRAVGLTEAAALPLAGLTALQALHERARLTAYPSPARVLVVGASGGIGSYAVQLAKLAGAHVTGVASGAKGDLVRDLGADVVVDRQTTPVVELRERWDVVVETTARYTFHELTPLLTDDGVLVSTRPISWDTVRLLRPARGERARFTFVATKPRAADLAHLADLVDHGQLRIPLDRVFGVEQAAAAHAYAEGPAVGKVVLSF